MPFNNLTIVVVKVTLIHGTKQKVTKAPLCRHICVFGPFLNCPIDRWLGSGSEDGRRFVNRGPAA